MRSRSTSQVDPGRRGRRALRPDRLDRRVLVRGWVASALLHILAFLWFSGMAATVPMNPRPRVHDASDPANRDALIGLRIAVAPIPVLPAPLPPLTVAEPRVAVATTPAPAPRLPAPAGLEAPRDAGRSGPIETRAGAGPPGSGSGEAESPPVPRSIFPEWDPPAGARGMEVTVRVRVDATGRPTGEVELVPPTPDRAFNHRLRQRAVRMEYLPARRGGVPVPGWAEITFVF